MSFAVNATVEVVDSASPMVTMIPVLGVHEAKHADAIKLSNTHFHQ